MREIYPYFTNDGSTGLFSPDADDIYHSTYGALTEAYEKFILPSNIEDLLKQNKEIKILDICFGIGYNTKSSINKILDFLYNEKIGIDNNKCIEKKYNNNIRCKLFIHAIDTDKDLACLSPFFITRKKNNKKEKLTFEQNKISRMLSNQTVSRFKLRKEVSILLLRKIYKTIDKETEAILYNKKYSKYFDKDICRLYAYYKYKHIVLTVLNKITAFLHNIYYKYLSSCNKIALNALRLLDFKFKLSIKDARVAIKEDKNLYNLIFLDAFTPVKCPCLWTVDFFKLLYEHLDDNGMILTYSNSALVRNAFVNAGFYVGKIYSESANKFTGTIAIKKHPSSVTSYHLLSHWGEGSNIHELSEYDLGLMKTKAGIFYRDKNLNLDNDSIIAAHKIEVENSNLMSSSKYIKSFKL